MLKRILQTTLLGLCCCSIGACSKEPKSFQGFLEGWYVYLSSSQSGYLLELPVLGGDKVIKDQHLFTLDPNPEVIQLKQSKELADTAEQNLMNLIKAQRNTILESITAQLQQAEAQYKLAGLTLERDKKLVVKGAISQSELDAAVATYDSALQRVNELKANLAEAEQGSREHLIEAQQATVSAAHAAVALQEWELKQKTFVAPYPTLVYDTFYKEGEYIPAGTPVLAILSPEKYRVVFYIPEDLFSTIHEGDKIYFTCDGCHKKITAKIRTIFSQAEYTPPVIYSKDTRHNLVFRVEANIAEPDVNYLNSGQPVEVFLGPAS